MTQEKKFRLPLMTWSTMKMLHECQLPKSKSKSQIDAFIKYIGRDIRQVSSPQQSEKMQSIRVRGVSL